MKNSKFSLQDFQKALKNRLPGTCVELVCLEELGNNVFEFHIGNVATGDTDITKWKMINEDLVEHISGKFIETNAF